MKKRNEDDNDGVEIILDFNDGFKFVKLASEESYMGELKSLGYSCIFYQIYNINASSLRDENDKPCCIIWKGKLIESKEEKGINPKYIKYITKFLETVNVHMLESTMKKIGYYKLDSIDTDLSIDPKYLFDGEYVSEGDSEHIKDENGEQYLGLGLLNIKKLFEIKEDYSIEYNFNLQSMINYSERRDKVSDIIEITNNSYSTAVANSSDSIAVANNYNSIAVTNNSDSIAVANNYNSTAVANYYNSTAVANSSYSTAVANNSDSIAVANSSYSTVVTNNSDSIAVANNSDSTAVANSSDSIAVANSSDSIAVANSSDSIAVANGKNSLAIARGYNCVAKGKIGTWLCLTEYDPQDDTIINMKVLQVDGVSVIGNTYYKLKDNDFIIVEDIKEVLDVYADLLVDSEETSKSINNTASVINTTSAIVVDDI